jgi:aspartyl-tRNA(Asn)/glutamyl-tRNA(Gln) amidotransferase subunit A
MPFNVTGLPPSPCGQDGDADLLGQLVGHPFAEPTVFRAAHAYEMATEWRKRRPAMVS